MTTPTVHILLAAYNRAHLIIETLQSIQNQTYQNFKCFITDDRSTDATATVVKQFCEKDARFTYYLKPDNYKQGLSDARNFGLDLAQADNAQYIQFFDDDDIMHPQKIELQIKELIDRNLDLCLCNDLNFENDYEFGAEKNDIHLPEDFSNAYLYGNIHFGAPIPVFKFDYLNKNRFSNLLFYAEEWVMFTQLFFQQKPKVGVVQRLLFYRRKHSESITLGVDKDFKKRKSSSITDVLLFNHFRTNNSFTPKNIVFLYRSFLGSGEVHYLKLLEMALSDLGKSHLTVFLFKATRNMIVRWRKLWFTVMYRML